jgi:hypothetical protein
MNRYMCLYVYILLNPFMLAFFTRFSIQFIQQSLPLSRLGLIVLLVSALYLGMTFDVPTVAQKVDGIDLATAGIATAATATATTSVRTAGTTCKKVGDQHKKSQNGEDRKLLTIFNGLCGGTYLEMGAFDGIRYSNTHLFNKALDWKGLLIEAGPFAFHNLTQNRPNELAVVHAAVCKEGKKTLHYVEPEKKWLGVVGGIWEFSTPSFRQQWWNGVTIEQAIPIQCMPLRTIIEENIVGSPAYFDIFSLDVEGAEFEALSSLDFSKAAFGIVLVEADQHNLRKNMAVRAILERNGYVFTDHAQNSQWFVNKDFDIIYQDVLYENAQ